MNLAGYLIHSPGGDIGQRGTAYTYVLAGNGLFLEAENSLLAARMLVAPAEVRGLACLEPELGLRWGKLPPHLMSLALVAMSARPDLEAYAAIVWDGQAYRLAVPAQEGSSGHVDYQPVPQTVVSIHSHGKMPAFFSGTDDRDEQGFQISIVLAHLDRLIVQAKVRLCLYGYFAPLKLRDIFCETPPGLLEWEE